MNVQVAEFGVVAENVGHSPGVEKVTRRVRAAFRYPTVRWDLTVGQRSRDQAEDCTNLFVFCGKWNAKID